MKNAAGEQKGADLKMSKTQIEKLPNVVAAFFLVFAKLAGPLVKPAVKALASVGLSFGAEKVLKKISGNCYGANEIKLYRLVQAMSPDQKKTVEDFLVGEGAVRGGGARQYGGFLGMLASIGVPLAIDLIGKMFSKGLQIGPPPPRRRRSSPDGGGMHINPPPFFGSWDDY